MICQVVAWKFSGKSDLSMLVKVCQG